MPVQKPSPPKQIDKGLSLPPPMQRWDLEPTAGPIGTVITLRGAFIDSPRQQIRVRFPGVKSPVVPNELRPNSLQVTVPPKATSGIVRVYRFESKKNRKKIHTFKGGRSIARFRFSVLSGPLAQPVSSLKDGYLVTVFAPRNALSGHNAVAVLRLPDLNVSASSLEPGIPSAKDETTVYQTGIALAADGWLNVAESGTYEFSLNTTGPGYLKLHLSEGTEIIARGKEQQVSSTHTVNLDKGLFRISSGYHPHTSSLSWIVRWRKQGDADWSTLPITRDPTIDCDALARKHDLPWKTPRLASRSTHQEVGQWHDYCETLPD